MLDLDKLWRKFETALAAETPESLTLWLMEQRRRDREAGVIRSFDIDFLIAPDSPCGLPANLMAEIDDTMACDIDYDAPSHDGGVRHADMADACNLAA